MKQIKNLILHTLLLILCFNCTALSLKLASTTTLGIDGSSTMVIPKTKLDYKWKIFMAQEMGYPPYEVKIEIKEGYE